MKALQKFKDWKSHFVISISCNHVVGVVSQNAIPVTNSDDLRGKHRKYLPYAFTEQGVAMLSAVIKSGTAVVFAGFWHSTSSYLSQESFTNTRTVGASITFGGFA